MDLLTVVLHEIGHVLGMDHVESGDSPLMNETLTAGDRVIHITSTEEVTTVAGSNDAADTGSDLSLRLLQTANEHYYRANRSVGVDYPDGHKRVTWSLLSL